MIVLGESDTGKSTFCTLLVRELCAGGARVGFVDAGLGEIKIPANVAEAMARQVAAALITQARLIEDVGAAQALNAMQGEVSNPAMLDRALLFRILRDLTEAIAQRK